MIIVTIFNYVIGGYLFRSYEVFVKKRLDKFLDKLNKDTFLERGMEWYVVPNHYWMELRVLANRRNNLNADDKPQLFSPSSSIMEPKTSAINPRPQSKIPQFSNEKSYDNIERVKSKFDHQENQITMKNIKSPKETAET